MVTPRFKRIFTIVLDSVGTGNAPDAVIFGDEGADTLGDLGRFWQGKLKLTNLAKLGLSNLRREPIKGIPVADPAWGWYGRMAEISAGKDSMDGHWEMMELPVKQKLSTFPDGFPQELINKIEQYSGRKVIVNRPYSGTKVIHDYGERQMKTGELIIYTSGDSVMQIAAHEEVIPITELYDICKYARILLDESKYLVGRVIARPYVGLDRNNFTRTANRHDFSLKPIGETVLDRLHAVNYRVIAVGKTNDIFSGQGIDQSFHNESNMDGMDHVDEVLKQDFTGFCFVNLVDFDAMYGHRRNPKGFGQALMDFDQRLGKVLQTMHSDDLLIITADHGNDPCFRGTDHTREEVPLLVWSPQLTSYGSLGVRPTYADVGATILENFDLIPRIGKSFLHQLK